jgi:hypothetical protein
MADAANESPIKVHDNLGDPICLGVMVVMANTRVWIGDVPLSELERRVLQTLKDYRRAKP